MGAADGGVRRPPSQIMLSIRSIVAAFLAFTIAGQGRAANITIVRKMTVGTLVGIEGDLNPQPDYVSQVPWTILSSTFIICASPSRQL